MTRTTLPTSTYEGPDPDSTGSKKMLSAYKLSFFHFETTRTQINSIIGDPLYITPIRIHGIPCPISC